MRVYESDFAMLFEKQTSCQRATKHHEQTNKKPWLTQNEYMWGDAKPIIIDTNHLFIVRMNCQNIYGYE